MVRELEREAAERAGSADFGSAHYREPLSAWAEDLQSPELNDFGRAFLRRLAVTALVRRARVLRFLHDHPEVASVALPRIVMISGLPRTGTTLAHNLLALHDRARALLRWELMEPLPPPEAASHASDPRIAKVQRSIDPLRGSALEHLHWVNAGEPEECVWGYLDCTNLLGRAAVAAMPRWRQHLMTADPRPTFREYRALVQLLVWHNPVPQGGLLILKCPQIADALDAFAEVFPEASFVLTHRDPFRALTSSCAVMHAINLPFSSQPPRLRADQDNWVARNQANSLAQMAQFAKSGRARVAHLHYPELMDDGPGACARVLRALGEVPDDAFLARAAAFLARQRRGGRAVPPEAYDCFGYDHDAVLGDPMVAGYCQAFGVLPERVRRTGFAMSEQPRD